MAKKITFGTTMVVLAVAQDAGGEPEVKLYSSTAKLMQSIRPFFGANYGYNTSIIVQPSLNKVFIAFGKKKASASARVMEVTSKSLIQVNNPTVAKTADKGQVMVQFLKLYSPNYGLVTMIANNPATLKVWKYSNATHRFDEDTSTTKNRVVVTGNTLSL